MADDSDNLDYSHKERPSEVVVSNQFIIRKYKKSESVSFRLASMTLLAMLGSSLIILIIVYFTQVFQVPFLSSQLDQFFKVIGV